MIFVALNEAADRGELLLTDGGMCRFHHRRDGFVVIRELLVLPECRRKGIGRALVGRVRAKFPNEIVRAVCPVEYEANRFWEAMGFHIAMYKRPKPGERQLAVWEHLP